MSPTLQQSEGIDNLRIRPQTPIYRVSSDECRPFDPSEDSRIHGVAEVFQQHVQWVADSRFDNSDIKTEYLLTVDDGDRQIEEYDGHGPHRDKVTAYPQGEEVGVPIQSFGNGDTINLLSVSEACEAYNGDGQPVFEKFDTTVAVVPDCGSIDGVGVCPLSTIDESQPHHVVGRVGQIGGFGFKSQKKGFRETVPIEVR